MDIRGNSPQGQGPTPDQAELRAAFERQSQAGRARGRSLDARTSRWAGMIASVLLGLGAATMLVTRLSQGQPAGLWTALGAVCLLLTVVGCLLAKAGRTRWTVAALVIALALAQLGDMPALRPN
ncbi:hypothetical protein [Streptomyces luteolus]|uniref:Integral membrane protein n=1 Tax=Streptomyces luteolus TaxID=3043615 RepID=A0ABT6T0E3_9ACTN|nr:hypothetical protein [Streptomyces sp. B-S-A12]MDI3421085.1 hypothetical protein [Streptomyces sp. B-S-A12]